MNKKLILLDLDDTLINTSLLKQLLPRFLKSEFDIPDVDFDKQCQNVKLENNGIYTLVDHVRKYKILSDKEIEKRFLSYFKNVDLLLPHTTELLTFFLKNRNCKVVIFTFGEPVFQKMKIKLYKVLQKPDLIIVESSKKEFIKSNLEDLGDNFKFYKYPDIFEKAIYVDDYIEGGYEGMKYLATYKFDPENFNLKKFVEFILLHSKRRTPAVS